MGTLDYNKKDFTTSEKESLLQETELLRKKYPERIPILVQLDSSVLTISKHKFLVGDDISLNYYIDVLKSKLGNLNPSDTLVIHLTAFNADGTKTLTKLRHIDTIPLKEFYKEHMDNQTGMLIFTLSRLTTVKWFKGFVNKYF